MPIFDKYINQGLKCIIWHVLKLLKIYKGIYKTFTIFITESCDKINSKIEAEHLQKNIEVSKSKKKHFSFRPFPCFLTSLHHVQITCKEQFSKDILIKPIPGYHLLHNKLL